MIERFLQRVQKGRGVSLSAFARKGAMCLAGRAAAPWRLRGCTRVGYGVRVTGAPRIVNRGAIDVGEGVILSSELGPVELETLPGACIEIGAGAFINYGTQVRAAFRIVIGKGAGISPHCTISDLGAAGSVGKSRPIVIGPHAWLASNVTVLPGADIGAGATIAAGSVVSGTIPAGSVAGGVPARLLRLPVEAGRRSQGGGS